MSTGGRLRFVPVELKRRRSERESVISIALSTAVGFGGGLLVGLVVGEWLGDVHPERVRKMFGAQGEPQPPADPGQIERDVVRALKAAATIRRYNFSARALEGGLVELTGIAPDERSRQVAGETAASVAGADLVVNRILVQGRDVPPGHVAPGSDAQQDRS